MPYTEYLIRNADIKISIRTVPCPEPVPKLLLVPTLGTPVAQYQENMLVNRKFCS